MGKAGPFLPSYFAASEREGAEAGGWRKKFKNVHTSLSLVRTDWWKFEEDKHGANQRTENTK